jgi:hypothetical protein
MEKDIKIPIPGSTFRKLYSIQAKEHYRQREKCLIEHLQSQPIYHPNIVSFYKVTDQYVDMELLEPLEFNDPLEGILPVMSQVKDFLQGIGVLYMDWKLDNIVKGKHGYTLIDFDNSGILEHGVWKVEPTGWSYHHAKSLYLHPKDMDDWSFDYNLVKIIHSSVSYTCPECPPSPNVSNTYEQETHNVGKIGD